MEPASNNATKQAAKRSQKSDEKLHRKFEVSLNKSTNSQKQRKETRKLTELKNPSDMTVDTRAEQALGLHKRARDEPPEEQAGQQLVPLRAHHSRETLSVRGQRDELPQEASVPTPDLYQQVLNANRRLYMQRNQQPRPMEELIRHGLLSPHIATLDERQDAAARQLRVDTDFVAAQLHQLHRAGLPNPLQARSPNELGEARKRPKLSDSDGAATGSQVTLSIGFGTHKHLFGYECRSVNEKREHCFALYDADQAARERAFFALDQLEEETPFCLRPARYKMHRQLPQEEHARFAERQQVPRLASSLVPRPAWDGEVSREYVQQYLYRPQAGAEQCYQGQSCVCYTFSPDPNVRYVGRPFYTPHQCEQLKRGEPLEANAEGLCFYCLVLKWTRQHQRNIRQQHAVSTYFNHFTLQVGPGQFSRDAMLEPVFNGRETGVMGHVLRFDEKKLAVSFITRRQIVRECLAAPVQPYAEAYLALQGLDF